MSEANEFEQLYEKVEKQFPDAEISKDIPSNPKSGHFLDVRSADKVVTLEWKPDKGFGFFSEDATFGEKPEKMIKSVDETFAQIVSLLNPPQVMAS